VAGAARIGRPAVISRDAIADAVASMRGDEVSVRAVAAKLGVSISTLYHWVSGRDEMLRIAGERSLNRFVTPEDHGQHWAVWLVEWAEHVFRAFSSEPALLTQFADGTLGLPRMLEAIDTALASLVRQGFTEGEAARAFHLVSQSAVGAAIFALRASRMRLEGHPFEHEYRRELARHPAAELPHLRKVAQSGEAFPTDLRADVVTIVVGIAARRGDRWRDVLRRLESYAAGTTP
jgi:AcrR family transcriptional regulator